MSDKNISKELFEFESSDANKQEQINKPSLSFWQDAGLRLLKNHGAMFGLFCLVLIASLAIIGPFLSTYSYKEQIQIKKLFEEVSIIEMGKEVIRIEFTAQLTEAKKEELYLAYCTKKEVDPEKYRGKFDQIVAKEVTLKLEAEIAALDVSKKDEYIQKYFELTGKEMPLEPAYKLPPRIKGEPFLFDGKNLEGEFVYVQRGIEQLFFTFGTDELGRDLWTRLWKGTQVSLMIGLISALIDLFIGVTYGAIAGFYGGKTDLIMMRIIEIIGSIPALVIVILMMMALREVKLPGMLALLPIAISIGLTGWEGMARVVRGQVLKLKSQEFILAARTLGTSNSRLIIKHLFPNILGPIIIMTTFSIPGAIFYEAFLSFIGLGLPSPNASLGVLINDGFKLLRSQPYLMVIPSIVISILMLGLNLFANGLRDALDPKMKNN